MDSGVVICIQQGGEYANAYFCVFLRIFDFGNLRIFAYFCVFFDDFGGGFCIF